MFRSTKQDNIARLKRGDLGEYTADQSPYIAEIKKHTNLACNILPALVFQYKNLDLLKTKLSHPEQFSGIAFPNIKAVRAVVKCGPFNAKWKNLPVFTIGESTRKLVIESLDLEVTASAGSASAVLPFILERNMKDPLLVPCGDLCKDPLSTRLVTEGRKVDPVEVFENVPHPRMAENLKAIQSIKPTTVVAFSPQALDTTLPHMKRLGYDVKGLEWIAVGPNTEKHMKKLGLCVVGSTTKTSPADVSQAVMEVIKDEEQDFPSKSMRQERSSSEAESFLFSSGEESSSSEETSSERSWKEEGASAGTPPSIPRTKAIPTRTLK